MSRCGIELTSNDPELLSFLVKYLTNSSWSVIEVENKHFLISPNFQGLNSHHRKYGMQPIIFSSVLNGIMKLKFKEYTT